MRLQLGTLLVGMLAVAGCGAAGQSNAAISETGAPTASSEPVGLTVVDNSGFPPNTSDFQVCEDGSEPTIGHSGANDIEVDGELQTLYFVGCIKDTIYGPFMFREAFFLADPQ